MSDKGSEFSEIMEVLVPKRKYQPPLDETSNGSLSDTGEKEDVTTYDIAIAFLNAMHVISWPNVGWRIAGKSGEREKAAEWLTKLVEDVNAIRNLMASSDMTVEEAARDYRRMVES